MKYFPFITQCSGLLLLLSEFRRHHTMCRTRCMSVCMHNVEGAGLHACVVMCVLAICRGTTGWRRFTSSGYCGMCNSVHPFTPINLTKPIKSESCQNLTDPNPTLLSYLTNNTYPMCVSVLLRFPGEHGCRGGLVFRPAQVSL